MTAPLRWAANVILRGAIALLAAVVVFYAGALVLAAILFARDGSRWWAVYVYEDGETDMADSRRRLLDIYGHAPLDAWGWLGYALLIGTAYATVVWGLWIIGRSLFGLLRPEHHQGLTRRSLRTAIRAFLWGVLALSAYALAVFLWDWIEWHVALDTGPTFPGDPKPGPGPAFDRWQIPLGVLAFAAIGALALFGLRAFRRRVTPGGRKDLKSPGGPSGSARAGATAPDPVRATRNRKASP
jgi:hypothetical protein